MTDSEASYDGENLTPIQNFFNGKSVFITGGSGFLGKVLMEKLCRSSPGIKAIYVLIRSKKKKSEEERIKEILGGDLFDEVRKRNPKFTDIIIPISGDFTIPEFGMSDKDRKLLEENVEVVFHLAATVRFDENLKKAVSINVNATQEIINLCYSAKNLKSFVYVSTAYSLCHLKNVKEEVGEWSPDFDLALELAKTFNEQEIEGKTASVLGKWPNTYTLTKALAESLVQKVEGQLPACIFRPGIVTSTYSEPLPGWLDNFLGPTGIIVGAGCGVVRAIHCNANADANWVPVDLTINALLASAYSTHKQYCNEEKKIRVYNFVTSPDNPLNYRDVQRNIAKYGVKIPSVKAVWYYSLILCNSKSQTYFLWLLFHWFPAFVIDIAAVFTARRPVTMKMYKKVHKMIDAMSYFATRSWIFQMDNVRSLWEETSEKEKELFPFDTRTIKWEHYLKNYITGTRKYILKEDMSTLKEARKRWKRLYWYHQTVKLIFVVLVFTIFWCSVRRLASITYEL